MLWVTERGNSLLYIDRKALTGSRSARTGFQRGFWPWQLVEKLRMVVENLGGPSTLSYAAPPKRTDTSFETPGSCMVTP
jgi:hypothetical protein